MKAWFLVAVLLALNSFGCGGAQSANKTVDPRAVSTAFVHTAVDVWLATAEICTAQVDQNEDEALREKCAAVLLPLHDSIATAADAVDGWTAADQQNWPCLAAAVLDGLEQLKKMVASQSSPDAGTPYLIDSVINLGTLFPGCVVDGGK
jgi:hypothetical protein